MREHAAMEAVAAGEHPRRLRRRNALEAAAKQRLERDVAVRLDHERVERLHAELAVAGPRLALAQALERADVDEHGRGALELNGVGGRVLEDQTLVEPREQQVELEQGGVAQHPERPLVGI